MRVDANALAAFGSEMEAQLKTLEQHIYEEAGGPFNINSPKQLGEVLLDVYKRQVHALCNGVNDLRNNENCDR